MEIFDYVEKYVNASIIRSQRMHTLRSRKYVLSFLSYEKYFSTMYIRSFTSRECNVLQYVMYVACIQCVTRVKGRRRRGWLPSKMVSLIMAENRRTQGDVYIRVGYEERESNVLSMGEKRNGEMAEGRRARRNNQGISDIAV